MMPPPIMTTRTGEHAPEHVPGVGAECDTDPDLAGATSHGDGHERVQTGRREDHRHEQNDAEDHAAAHHPGLLLRDDVVESDDIPEVQTGIDLLPKGGHTGRKPRRVPRDAHGDHERIDLGHGRRTIEVRCPTPIGGERPQIGDHADDLLPGARLALAAPLERSDSCAHGIPAHHAHGTRH